MLVICQKIFFLSRLHIEPWFFQCSPDLFTALKSSNVWDLLVLILVRTNSAAAAGGSNGFAAVGIRKNSDGYHPRRSARFLRDAPRRKQLQGNSSLSLSLFPSSQCACSLLSLSWCRRGGMRRLGGIRTRWKGDRRKNSRLTPNSGRTLKLL